MIDVCKNIYVGLVQSIINHGTVGELNIIACFGLNSHYFDNKKDILEHLDLQAPRTSLLIMSLNGTLHNSKFHER